jgi:hypothetical protein
MPVQRFLLALQRRAKCDCMRNMKRLALSALVLLIPAVVRADEKETMLHALGQFQQASKTPCTISSNPCQTREIWLAQQAAQAADQYLNTRDAKSVTSGIGGSWRYQLSNTAKCERKRTRHTYTLVIKRRTIPSFIRWSRSS